MKKTVTLLLIFGLSLGLGLTAASATAEAGWYGTLRGVGKILPEITAKNICLRPTCAAVGKNCGAIEDGCGGTLECGTCSGIDTCGGGGAANICGQTCYRFAYLADGNDGIQDIFSGGNCLSAPENLTQNTVRAVHSHLTSGRGESNLAFLQARLEGDESDGSDWMNLMNVARKSWNLLDHGTPSRFEPKAVAWDASGRLAILAKENDGSYALRLDAGPYFTADDSVIVRHLGMVPPQDMEWVPIPGETRYRYLIVSFGSFPASTSLYVLDTGTSPARLAPLEETAPGSSLVRAMRGSQPATGRLGTSLLFVREGRILSCNLDFSHMGDALPRAYCPNAWEPTYLRDVAGEMASPSVSHDNQWLFFSMKRPATSRYDSPSWEIYRSRFDHFQLHQMTATPDVDEIEIASLAPWYGPVTGIAQATTTVREEPKYEVSAVFQTPVQTLQTRCTTDAECPSGQECNKNICRVP